MEDNLCPKYKTCPIFQGTSSASQNLERIFKQLYCNAGKTKYATCKRYIVSEQVGVAAPKHIFPNSSLSVDEIKKIMKNMGML
jgi:hypothetical protein